MEIFNCPSCGAEVKFTSGISVSAVCPYCRSLIVRHDKDVELIGTMAELPADLSPFQIGAGGTYRGVHFGIIGRLRVGWEDGQWNEWFLYMDNGKRAWLAEAQGALAIITEIEPDAATAKADYVTRIPTLSKLVTLNGKNYTVADIKNTECLGSEGELPFTAPKGRKTLAIDLVNPLGEFAGIEIAEGQHLSLFTGEYVEFDDLQFSNLRELPGWGLPKRVAAGANGT